jgi:hypothetical protein
LDEGVGFQEGFQFINDGVNGLQDFGLSFNSFFSGVMVDFSGVGQIGDLGGNQGQLVFIDLDVSLVFGDVGKIVIDVSLSDDNLGFQLLDGVRVGGDQIVPFSVSL